MPLEQNVERRIIAIFVELDEMLISLCFQVVHYYLIEWFRSNVQSIGNDF